MLKLCISSLCCVVCLSLIRSLHLAVNPLRLRSWSLLVGKEVSTCVTLLYFEVVDVFFFPHHANGFSPHTCFSVDQVIFRRCRRIIIFFTLCGHLFFPQPDRPPHLNLNGNSQLSVCSSVCELHIELPNRHLLSKCSVTVNCNLGYKGCNLFHT